jgi:putative peptidoglycan lipid II flippase
VIAGLLGQIAAFQAAPAHRKVASAAAIVAAFTLLGKVAGGVKELVIAHRFGTSHEIDAFLVAFLLPSFAISVVGGSLNSALMPVYVEERQQRGDEAARRLVSSAMVMSLALLVAAAIILLAAVPAVLPLVASRFSEEKLRLTRQLSFVLVPSLVVSGMTTTWTAVLNARGRFALPSGAALATPAVTIAALLAFGKAWGIYALAGGLVAGFCVESVIVAHGLHRERLLPLPRWHGMTPALRRVAAQYAPMAAGMLVLGANPIIDQLMAAQLAPGSIASLGYGQKLLSFAMGIGAASLGTALLPHFSSLVARKEWETLSATLRSYSVAILSVAVPLTLACIALSETIVRLLFERGAFTSADTAQVARIQAFYLAALPIRLTGVLFVRFMIATGANHVLMFISVGNAVLNVIANWVLSRYFGAAGIALSTSVVFTLANAATFLFARRRLRALRGAAASAPVAEEAAP